MTAFAYVDHRFPSDRLAVWLGDRGDHGTRRVVEPLTLVIGPLQDNDGAIVEPTLTIPEDMARALLDALAAHFGGVSEVQTLRKDYDAERARVDRLVGFLTRAEQA